MNIHINSTIRCKNCGRLNSVGSSSCRYCGCGITNVEDAVADSNAQKKSEKRNKNIWFVILGVFVLFILISIINSNSNSKKTTNTSKPTDVEQSNVRQPEVVQQPVEEPEYESEPEFESDYESEPEFESDYETNKVVYSPYVNNAPNKMRVSISKITLSDSYTSIECVVDNTNGSYSYIAIGSDTYIVVNGNYVRLVDTDGIGISPDKTAIAKGRVSSFSLYFPSIPQNTETIDLIESGKNGWKFYGIQLK